MRSPLSWSPTLTARQPSTSPRSSRSTLSRMAPTTPYGVSTTSSRGSMMRCCVSARTRSTQSLIHSTSSSSTFKRPLVRIRPRLPLVSPGVLIPSSRCPGCSVASLRGGRLTFSSGCASATLASRPTPKSCVAPTMARSCAFCGFSAHRWIRSACATTSLRCRQARANPSSSACWQRPSPCTDSTLIASATRPCSRAATATTSCPCSQALGSRAASAMARSTHYARSFSLSSTATCANRRANTLRRAPRLLAIGPASQSASSSSTRWTSSALRTSLAVPSAQCSHSRTTPSPT
mmetsp:Transcript_38774/g.102256  ORF Transcript_38774/g.102256 Transcript_38774/m.102256 type:complete len:293 (-) Transcript_38774:2634-3512(-)